MVLTSRWTQLEPHAEQDRLVDSPARFCVVAAGRRSGKTERAKRRLIQFCLDPPKVPRPKYIACAPVRDQAKRIWWQDLKDLSPPEWVHSISESDLEIRFRSGARVAVVGLDKPQRAEGEAIDGACLDEYAECKPESWTQSLRPALSTRGRPPGWCWFTGRPRGRNHFYELWTEAKTREGWDSFRWPSADIIDPLEIEAAKRDLDELTFRQEYEADFITFEGLAYYQWDPNVHLRAVPYEPGLPLIFCFDFNVEPGVAVIAQERLFVDEPMLGITTATYVTCVIGEVHIPRNSNTPAVCRRLCKDWGDHKGPVYLYGDPTGHQRNTAAIDAKGDKLVTDWDLVREYLKPTFGVQLKDRVGTSSPRERDRVNAVNSRMRNAAGQVRLLVHPKAAPHVVKDFEGVTLLQGGSGEIDKGADETLTHLTDALGYYIHLQHPISGAKTLVS